MPENAEVYCVNRTCNEIQGFELDDEQQNNRLFSTKQGGCLLTSMLIADDG